MFQILMVPIFFSNFTISTVGSQKIGYFDNTYSGKISSSLVYSLLEYDVPLYAEFGLSFPNLIVKDVHYSIEFGGSNTSIVLDGYLDFEGYATFEIASSDFLNLITLTDGKWNCEIYFETPELLSPSISSTVFCSYFSISCMDSEILNWVDNSYDSGYSDGVTDSNYDTRFNVGFLEEVFNSVSSFFNVPILPGFKIWYLIGVPVMISVVYGVLKVLR